MVFLIRSIYIGYFGNITNEIKSIDSNVYKYKEI